MLFSMGASAQTTTFIYFESQWKYYDQGNEPALQSGLRWYKTSFSDSNWSSGQGELGYGDNDETTELNDNATTIYMRKRFFVTDASDFENLQIELLYDDGAVLYINGTEVKRINMPSGSINYGTYTPSDDGDNEMVSFSIPSSQLVDGYNLIAVEMHQRNSSSSDLSFDLKLKGTEGNASGGSGGSTTTRNIVRGPYLQKATSRSIVVKWKTDYNNASIIKYGTSPNNLNRTKSNNTEKKDHELEITGLSPNTKYYYSIEHTYSSNVNLNSDLYFKTHPEIGAPQPLHAWVLGDCGTKDSRQRRVRDGFMNFNDGAELDMILLLGDNAYKDGKQYEYQDAIFEDMYEETLKNTTAWSTFGNHDSHDASSSSQTGTYYDIFTFPKQGESGGVASGTEAYYSFDYGNIHFIVLDSEGSGRDDDDPMYEWCENDIQNTLADWIIAFWHHPPYSKGSHDSDDESQLRDMREVFVPMLEENGVDLVLGGHSHSYERSYLLNGHYGKSYTFDEDDHTVGSKGFGNGKKNGDGAYKKEVTGSKAGDGAVYIVAGSSGKRSDGDLDHDAMYVGLDELGSCLLEVEGNELNLKFINDEGVVEDYFTLEKEINSSPSGGGSNNGGGSPPNTTTPNCDDIVIIGENDGVFVDGTGDAPKVIVEVYNVAWNPVYSCVENCDAPTSFIPLSEGIYNVSVKYFMADYGWICQKTETVEVSGGYSNASCDISVWAEGDDIKINGYNAANRIVKVFNENWEEVVDCLNNCDSYEEISNFADGEYYVRLLGYDANWTPICEYSDYVTIGSGSNLLGNGQASHLSLQATKSNKSTRLQWVTNTDFKNHFFELERSTNGLEFEVVRRFESESDTEEYYNYNGLDLSPKEGINYYRIKQVYHNGDYRYSNTRHLEFPKGSSDNSIFPNPANGMAYLDLRAYAGQKANIQLTNTLGEIVFSRKVASIPEYPIELSLDGLASGAYLVSVGREGERSLVFKLVVERL